METEQRIIELETKLAFMDNTIEELNQVVIDQQQQIDRLEQELKMLSAKLRTLTGAPGDPGAIDIG